MGREVRAINDARVVTPDGILEGASIVLEDGRISGITARAERSGEAIDAAGRYVLPGMVDLHCDAIEKQLAPRPGVEVPEELAFMEMDRLFAGCGVTTGFHGVSIMAGRSRGVERGRRLCALVSRLAGEGLVRHELHLRCELPQEESVRAVEEVLGRGFARLVSVMDHTPGQGQFRDLEWFRRYWSGDGADEAQISAALAEAERSEYTIALDRVGRIASAAKKHGATLASHDDDTVERVEVLAGHGVDISEFPVNAASARRARELGHAVCMGAPNALRGVSSGGNLSALEAVEAGLVDALVSDYHPPSMLQAAFKLAREDVLPLPESVALVTGGPARAAGLSDRGGIARGAKADLIIVGGRAGIPTVTHTIVNGESRHAAG
ncbi:alpha-D-ribose 1-methylphosphonate 5-triphosphate diphosphatase [Rubrobacter tropicus]|uniref:alpha-D-ribose 1-methylphosphonate 5-triphosphate diphosphatase n=1 Tax=Rubrobacter tropicus TaxID=2653851 RepID=UPI00140AE525|nr:alpha-D-ribose 1-methylphosphonate 5-triphosphate diphosphatase [Rubrobacter tropicus]